MMILDHITLDRNNIGSFTFPCLLRVGNRIRATHLKMKNRVRILEKHHYIINDYQLPTPILWVQFFLKKSLPFSGSYIY